MHRIRLVGVGSDRRNDDEDRGNEARYEGHEAHLEGVSGAGRDESAKRENLDYNESIYCDMYRGRTDGAVERVGRIAVKMWTLANFSRDRRRRSSTHAPT
jgi:hypothetical protein